MTADQKDYHAMVRAVLATFTKHATTAAAPPALVRGRTALLTTEARINAARRRQDDALGGITTQKEELQAAMVDAVLPLAGMLHAFAAETGDPALKARADFSHSDLINLPDLDCANTCADLLVETDSRSTALTDYGLTTAALEAAEDLTEEFGALIGAPRRAIGERKNAREAIEDAITDSRLILKDRLDVLLRQFDVEETGDPANTARRALFQDYTHARIIVNAASRAPGEEERVPAPPVA